MPDNPDGRAERASWLRIALTPGIGPVAASRLLAAFGLPEDILGADHAALRQFIGAGPATALLRTDPLREAAIATSLRWSEQAGCRLLTLIDPAYPALLLQTADPPPVLWVQGRTELLSRPALAIVGSRSASRGGMEDAANFARSLSEQGLTIISGLALGIDASAHRGALGTPGGTVAVMGTGTDRIYPRQQAPLARAIAQHGLLMSELPPGTEPWRGAFPRRNRLIAGLSLGVLVVEAALRSGSLITARLAADLGREVFAMPGSIHSPTSKGCHLLLKEGARLVESAEDVLSELRLSGGAAGAGRARPDASASGDTEDPLLTALGWDPIDTDTLMQRLLSSMPTGRPKPDSNPDRPGQKPAGAWHGAQSHPVTAPDMLERLVCLELMGRIERLHDGRVKRLPK